MPHDEESLKPILPDANERLDGIDAIAAHLAMTPRQVRYAREIGSLPIRFLKGLGLYAFKSELLAALKSPATLPNGA